MKILILGSGGREHVFALQISKSPLCKALYIAPGNAGTHECGTNVDLNPMDFDAVAQFCIKNQIDMVVPGNEDPLVGGITPFLERSIPGIVVAGPSTKGAKLEGSKDYAKEFMLKYNIPTARFSTFTQDTLNSGLQFLETLPAPYVLKADGLAAGKGVIIAQTIEEARQSLKEMLVEAKFGNASSKVVIEEFLPGIEVSCFVLTDGNHYLMLPEAKDYKRIGEGDTGLNTGGMGAVSPVPFADEAFLKKVKERIIEPTLNGLRKEKAGYKGFLFIGLMNCNGEPFVIEYNVRMGDPETEVVLPRVQTDLVSLLHAACTKKIHKMTLDVSSDCACTVFVVSGGYPESYKKGKLISGLDSVTDCTVYHAGTQRNDSGEIRTNGGRVLAFTALDNQLKTALEKAMSAAESVQFEGKYYRKDIGQDLLALLGSA